MRNDSSKLAVLLMGAVMVLGGCGGGHGPHTPVPGTLQFSAANYFVNEDGSSVTPIIITRTTGSDGVVTATLTPTAGTATAGTDYVDGPITVTFADGDTTPKVVNFPVIDDHLDEADETLILTITATGGGASFGGAVVANVTIIDNDVAGALSFTQGSYSAHENGQLVSQVAVQRTGGQDGVVTATITFADITATGGASPLAYPYDYDSTPIVVTFADQDTATKLISFAILNDDVPELDEALSLQLSNPTGNATIGAQSNAGFTILTDDQRGTIALAASTYFFNEDGSVVTPVTVTRTGGSQGIVSGTISFTNMTATGGNAAPADFNNAPIVVTFADGDTAPKTVNIVIYQDNLVEGAEQFGVTLCNPTNQVAIGSPSTATCFIADDDAAGQIEFSGGGFSVREDGVVINAITVRRINGNDGVVSATMSLANGTAIGGPPPLVAPVDFNNTPIVVTFGDQDTTDKIVTVAINDDVVAEASETVFLALGSPTGQATIGAQATSLLTIVDNDQAGQVEFTAAAYSVSEDGTPASAVTLHRINGTSGIVSVTLTPSNGTATGGPPPLAPPVDFNNQPIVVAWSHGDAADKTVIIPVLNDTVVEANETVLLALSNPTGGVALGAQAAATLTIVNDDAAGALAFSAAAFSVNENGTPVVPVRVTRTGGNDGAVSATITLSNGTATGGSALGPGIDYVDSAIVVTFADQDTADKIITIPINDDNVAEPDETVNLAIGSPTNQATIGAPAAAVLTILTDDQRGSLEFTAAAFSENENGTPVAAVTVRRINGSQGAVSATITLTNGTATGGSGGPGVDYDNSPIVVTFADADTTDKVIQIPIFDDHVVEGNETVNLALGSPTNGATVGPQGTSTLTILDDDQAGAISFSGAAYFVNEDGTPVVPVTVTRTGGNAGIVTATITLTNGTATGNPAPVPGADYNDTPIVVTFADQDMAAQIINVPIYDDAVTEGPETINLALGSPTNSATIGATPLSVLTIVANDQYGTLEFTAANFSINENGTPVTAITLHRVNGSQGIVSVSVTPGNVTATGGFPLAPGIDFDNSGQSVTWTDGDTANKTLVIPIQNDTTQEGNETFTLTLAIIGPLPAILGAQSMATVTIVDDDAAGTIELASVPFSYNEDGTAINAIRVRRLNGDDGAVSVTMSFGDVTATGGAAIGPGVDYVNTGIVVNFADQDAADKLVVMTVNDDHLVEGPETFTATIAAPTGGATLGATTNGTVTIVDNDLAGTLEFGGTTFRVNEDGTWVNQVRLHRTNGQAGNVSATITFADVSATGGFPLALGIDYDNTSITVIWLDQDAADKLVNVAINDDTVQEALETATMTLGAATGGATIGASSVATLEIVSDDINGTVSLTSATYAGAEVDGSTPNLVVTLTRSFGAAGAITVDVVTADGTATSPADYTGGTTTVSWANGDSSPKTVLIPIADDNLVEGSETFTVTAQNPTGGAVLGAITNATCTIHDDDAYGVLGFTSATFSIREDGTPIQAVTVRRTFGKDGAVSAVVSLANGTATGGVVLAPPVDYNNTALAVNFADQDNADKVVVIPITNDHVVEPDETFGASLGTPVNAQIDPTASLTTVTIVNDDHAGSISFTSGLYYVQEDGVEVLGVRLSRAGGADGAVSVTVVPTVNTGPDGASPGSDYDPTPIVVTWADQDSGTKTVTLPIVNDAVSETNELVWLVLSAPTGGAALGPQTTALLTILDDDGAGTLMFDATSFSVTEGTPTVTVQVDRIAGSSGAISVHVDITNLTAHYEPTILGAPEADDYTPPGGVFTVTLNWANADSAPKTFNIAILDDAIPDGFEQIGLSLSSPGGGSSIGPMSSATVNISDNDVPFVQVPNATNSGGRYSTGLAGLGNVYLVGAPFQQSGATSGAGVVDVMNPQTNAVNATIAPAFPQTDAHFGTTIVTQGHTVVISSPFYDTGGPDNGIVDFYTDINVPPVSITHVFGVTNPNPSGGGGDHFGDAMLFVGTDRVAIAAPGGKHSINGNNCGVVYIYDAVSHAVLLTINNPDSTVGNRFGTSLAVGGSILAVGDPLAQVGVTPQAGVVHLFNVLSGAYIRSIVNPAPTTGDQFGAAVAINPQGVVVGAPFADVFNVNGGVAYAFELTGGLLETYGDSTICPTNGNFGSALLIDPTFPAAFMAAPGDAEGRLYFGSFSPGFPGSGGLIFFTWQPSDWGAFGSTGGAFGLRLAFYDSTVLIGAPFETVGGTANRGRLYMLAYTP